MGNKYTKNYEVIFVRKDLVVPVEKLKNSCDLKVFQFETTEEIPPIKEIIGQERAMKALKFGLSVKKKGYNIFVTGITGTGRNSYSYSVAKDFAKKKRLLMTGVMFIILKSLNVLRL